MTLSARALQAIFPSYGTCSNCGMPWAVVEGHYTKYSEVYGCFPLCEKCWPKLSIAERLPHYKALVAKWREQSPGRDADFDEQERLIVAAVVYEP